MSKVLTKEQELVLLASRLTFSNQIVERIVDITADTNFNWFEFYKYCLYHRTFTLAYQNIRKLAGISIPKYLADIHRYVYYANQKRNTANQNEIHALTSMCKSNGITVVPVKGAMLVPELYSDYGLRYSGDIDFLFDFRDRDELVKLLEANGYQKGRYSNRSECVLHPDRREELKWKLYFTSLQPYVKETGNYLYPAFSLDFRHSLDDDLNKEPIQEIIAFARSHEGRAAQHHYLAHLCCHFHDEARHSLSVFDAKDFNLIKLCDIREYILKYISERELELAVSFLRKYNLEHKLLFALYFVQEIYGDQLFITQEELYGEHEICDLLTFGDNMHGKQKEYSKDLYSLLFSCNNKDELSHIPTAIWDHLN